MLLFPEWFLNGMIIVALAGTALAAASLLYMVIKDIKNKRIW